MQLTYLGPPEVQIKAEGVIEGCGVIKRAGKDVKIKSPTEQFESAKTPWWFFLAMPAMGILTTWGIGKEVLKDWKVRRKVAIIEIGFVIFSWGGVAFVLWDALKQGPLGPPFGF